MVRPDVGLLSASFCGPKCCVASNARIWFS